MIRRLIGGGIMWLCAGIDLIPWREDGKWYRHGTRGCVWGLSEYGWKIYEGS